MSSPPALPDIRIIPADEVLATHTRESLTGDLLFEDASGATLRLITTTADPEVSNRGDGTFHPATEAGVLSALAEIPRPFLAAIAVDIYILPYPRSGILSSSADSRAIYLSPGVWEMDAATEQGRVVAHEIGHLVHRSLLPDEDQAGWNEFLALHGVDGDPRYHAGAPHAYQPHELFAEDFRVLFGGAAARGDGAVENPEISLPGETQGLSEFMLALAGESAALEPPAPDAWRAAPNPARALAVLTLAAPAGIALDGGVTLHDAAGRVVASVAARDLGAGRLSLNLAPLHLAAGAYWIHVGSAGRAIPIRLLH